MASLVPFTTFNLTGNVTATDDVLTIPNFNGDFVGDAGGNILGNVKAGHDTLTGIDATDNVLVGDAFGNILGNAKAGNDILTGGADTGPNAHENQLYGDAHDTMSGNAKGGSDTLLGGAGADNHLFGDADSMTGNARGGNDILTGGAGSQDNQLIGDADSMTGNARGGNDILTAGDALPLALPLPANQFANTLIGDATRMTGNARAGNDTLISGTGNDDMWGDAQHMSQHIQGGADTFVFKALNGHDVIEDFGQGLNRNAGTDHIDVSALGITDFAGLTISSYDANSHTSTITFSVGNDVVVHSDAALTAHDFLFA
jgi:Ca2+-binding RTX toxin-like protein